ncbi:MAG: hypothetical protein RIQ56_579, partial [Candidatus Parcubacteria bacterium]
MALAEGGVPMWEYKVVDLRDSPKLGNRLLTAEDQLNLAGRDGWELVCVEGGQSYFKRRIVPQQTSRQRQTQPATGA